MNRMAWLNLVVFSMSLPASIAHAAFLDSPAWTAAGNQPDARFGFSVASAGDVNADGYSDVLIGAPRYPGAPGETGAAFLFLGSPTGLSSLPAWTSGIGQSGAAYGHSVGTAGDVNGDGYDDVVIGAPGYDGEGAAFLYLGSSTGLSPTAARVWQGGQADAEFGSAVTGAGDVNGDDLADVLVGAPGFDSGLADQGAAFLFTGSSTALPTHPAWSGTIAQQAARFGASVAGLGDLTGDGLDEVGIGAPLFDGGHIDEGRAQIFAGTPSGLGATPLQNYGAVTDSAHFGHSIAAGDLNADGTRELLFGSPLYDYTHRDEGASWLANLGLPFTFLHFGQQDFAHRGVSVASAGDVNGDGLTDVIVGANLYDSGEQDEGVATLYLGSTKFVVERFPAGAAQGNQPFADFGFAVASAGDVNGDGFGDVIVGAPLHDDGEEDEGRAVVYLGGPDLVGVADETPSTGRTELRWARPNPFHSATTLTYVLPHPGRVRLAVLDVTGRERVVLEDGFQPAGSHSASWNGRDEQGRDCPAGLYFIRLALDEQVALGRVVRVR